MVFGFGGKKKDKDKDKEAGEGSSSAVKSGRNRRLSIFGTKKKDQAVDENFDQMKISPPSIQDVCYSLLHRIVGLIHQSLYRGFGFHSTWPCRKSSTPLAACAWQRAVQ